MRQPCSSCYQGLLHYELDYSHIHMLVMPRDVGFSPSYAFSRMFAIPSFLVKSREPCPKRCKKKPYGCEDSSFAGWPINQDTGAAASAHYPICCENYVFLRHTPYIGLSRHQWCTFELPRRDKHGMLAAPDIPSMTGNNPATESFSSCAMIVQHISNPHCDIGRPQKPFMFSCPLLFPMSRMKMLCAHWKLHLSRDYNPD